MPPFENFDLDSFWEHSEYADRAYTEAPPTAATLAEVEAELGCKLPTAYIALAAHRNGGMPAKSAHRVTARTSWAEDHIAIHGIFAIGRNKDTSLCGECGSGFWLREWGYPDIGVYFADCPSAGHDMLCLDYRACGPAGEPTVVHVDQERDYRITVVAPNFEAFIRSLQDSDDFDI